MPSKAFTKIMAGVRDAQAYVNGDKSRGRIVAGPGAPEDPHGPLIDVTKIRTDLGLSQLEFARGFGVPVKTLQNWEQGRRAPKGAALTLLTVIEKNPEVVVQTVWPQKAKRPRHGVGQAR